MKKIFTVLLLFVNLLLLSGCSWHVIDFGCKMAAVHSCYDAMPEYFEREYAKEDERKYIEENPVRAAYFYRFLGICERFRNNKEMAQKAFDKSLAFCENPLTYYHLAKFALRERDIENAGKYINSMENAIAEKIYYHVNYYEFLLTGLTWQEYEKLIKNKTTIESFYVERCDFLKKTLAKVKNMPSDILPALHNIALENAEKIRYGMKYAEVEKLLGKPKFQSEDFRGAKKCFYLINNQNALYICLLFSANGSLGDIAFCRRSKYGKYFEWIWLENSIYAIQWRLN